MSGLEGISRISTQMPSLPAGPGKAGGGSSDVAAGFGKALKGAMQNVEQQQQHSTLAVQDLLTGNTADSLPVVSAVAKADLSFKLLIGVRNKVIEAYKQTINMQV